jgi:RNA polymerase sigma-70 factor, ECF subfamily
MQACPNLPTPELEEAAPRLSPEALVEGLRRSDPASTRSFFEAYSRRVERTLRHLLGATPDLEDVVHDVFVHALEGIDKLRDPAALGSWVTGITVLTAKQRLRKEQRFRRWLCFSPSGQLPDRAGPATEIEARAAFGSVHELLGALRHEDKIALVLHRVEGLTIPVAAQVMNISTGTFKRRLRRAERHLLKLAQRSSLLRIWLYDGGRPS